MMIRHDRKGFSVIEYAMMIIIIVVGFVITKDYILRGLMGRWKNTGDSFGLGRQYDPQRTLDCVYDREQDVWYEQGCFDAERQECAVGNFECERNIIRTRCAIPACSETRNEVTVNKES